MNKINLHVYKTKNIENLRNGKELRDYKMIKFEYAKEYLDDSNFSFDFLYGITHNSNIYTVGDLFFNKKENKFYLFISQIINGASLVQLGFVVFDFINNKNKLKHFFKMGGYDIEKLIVGINSVDNDYIEFKNISEVDLENMNFAGNTFIEKNKNDNLYQTVYLYFKNKLDISIENIQIMFSLFKKNNLDLHFKGIDIYGNKYFYSFDLFETDKKDEIKKLNSIEAFLGTILVLNKNEKNSNTLINLCFENNIKTTMKYSDKKKKNTDNFLLYKLDDNYRTVIYKNSKECLNIFEKYSILKKTDYHLMDSFNLYNYIGPTNEHYDDKYIWFL